MHYVKRGLKDIGVQLQQLTIHRIIESQNVLEGTAKII